MGKVASNSQHAFIEGKQILDTILIANKTIDSRLKGLESRVICKMDIEKAYDFMNWGFLVAIMEKMGFRAKRVS